MMKFTAELQTLQTPSKRTTLSGSGTLGIYRARGAATQGAAAAGAVSRCGSARATLVAVHALFRVDEPLPVPPGKSPFRIRGIYYDRLLSVIRKDLGTDGLSRAVDDARVREFAAQKFSWTDWYDALPAVPICAGVARTMRMDFEWLLIDRTRRGALEVIPSAFRLALKAFGPTAFASQVGNIAATMMNYVDLDIEASRERHTSGWSRRVPSYLAPHTAGTVLGFFGAIIEMRGAHDVHARYTDVVRDGTRDGFDTVSVRYEFDWK